MLILIHFGEEMNKSSDASQTSIRADGLVAVRATKMVINVKPNDQVIITEVIMLIFLIAKGVPLFN